MMTDQARLPFDGETYEDQRDGQRLFRSLQIIRQVMRDGRWHTLDDLALVAGCSPAAASARLRDLRKKKFGGYTIDREYVANGLWRYRMEIPQ